MGFSCMGMGMGRGENTHGLPMSRTKQKQAMSLIFEHFFTGYMISEISDNRNGVASGSCYSLALPLSLSKYSSWRLVIILTQQKFEQQPRAYKVRVQSSISLSNGKGTTTTSSIVQIMHRPSQPASSPCC